MFTRSGVTADAACGFLALAVPSIHGSLPLRAGIAPATPKEV